jgi:hypothetical protein
MKTKLMSERTREMFAIQGYVYYSTGILKNLVMGIKIPYFIHGLLMLFVVSMESMVALAILMVVSLAGIVIPYHPIDLLYNKVSKNWMKKPRLPRRPKQTRFGFMITGLSAIAMMALFMMEMPMYAYYIGYMYIMASLLNLVFDINISSAVFNYARFGIIYPNEWARMKIMMREA